MGLFSFLKRNRSVDDKAPAAASDDVQRARTRARQRLIGAVVLLGVGVIGFPLVFETQPRPIPVDIPIEIPRKDNAQPVVLPPPRAKATPKVEGTVITESATDAGKEVPPPAPASAPVAVAKPVVPEPAAPPQAAEAARAKALLEGKPVAKTDENKPPGDSAAKDGRFVVQVGAFAEASAARETRLKVEKLGLKTYTQVVEVDGGKRIRVRVGPFASRDEADKAAGKIKSAGLPSAILSL